jgi:hypothetical protein
MPFVLLLAPLGKRRLPNGNEIGLTRPVKVATVEDFRSRSKRLQLASAASMLTAVKAGLISVNGARGVYQPLF